jgi:hypothetical protein
MLAKRLARHGLLAAGGALGALLSQSAAPASVPALVMSSTIEAVTSVAAGQTAAAGLISANVAALSERVVKSMLLTKLRNLAAALLALSIVALTSAMLLAGTQTPDNGKSGQNPPAADKPPPPQNGPITFEVGFHDGRALKRKLKD